MAHVVILGAGPGGLASAMLLASAGLRVTVLERGGRVGGRTQAIEQDGFRFDTGPTFFLYKDVLREIFATCGRDLDREVPMVRLDPQYHLVFEDAGDLRATPDLARMEREIARFSSADAANLRAFIHDNRRKFQAFKPILQSPFSSWRDLLSTDMIRRLPLVRPWSSVDGDLRRYFSDPRIRLAFSFQSKYLGMSPFQCPSLFTILSYLEYDYGVYHPIGGCAAVSERMAEIAADMGVDIRLNDEAEQILFEGRRAVGVRSRSGTHRADALVVNADFAQAMHKLVPDRLRRRWRDRKLARKRYSCSTFMMYLGIDGRYDDLAHHTIFLSRDYRRNLRQIERDHVLSDEPSFYVQNASVTDGTLAPAGGSTLYVLAPVTHMHPNVNWDAQRDRFRALLLRRLEKLGLTDLPSRIRYERVLTPADWQQQMAIYRGATFNLAHTIGQMLHRRPQNRFEDLEGVYLTGGGTHPGSGLPVIYEGARISARLLLADLGITTTSPAEPVSAAPAGAERVPAPAP